MCKEFIVITLSLAGLLFSAGNGLCQAYEQEDFNVENQEAFDEEAFNEEYLTEENLFEYPKYYGTNANRPVMNFFEISSLNIQKPSLGAFHTKGYVVDIYQCPVCEKEEECSPCVSNYIILSEKKKLLDKSLLDSSEILIFVDDTSIFKIGKEYTVLFQILDVKTIDQTLNNLKLIYATAIKEEPIVPSDDDVDIKEFKY